MATDIPSDAPFELPAEHMYALGNLEREMHQMMSSNQRYFNINWINLNELDNELLNDLKALLNTLYDYITGNDNQTHRACSFALSSPYFTSKFSALMFYTRVEDVVSNLSKQALRTINHFIDNNHPIPSDYLEYELLRICKIYDMKQAEKVEEIISKCKVAEYKPVSHGIKYFDCETEELVCIYDGNKRIKFTPAVMIRALLENNPLINN